MNNQVLLSEHTKNLTPEELEQFQKSIKDMDEKELAIFRNSFDPDSMGHFEAEAI